MYVVSILCVVLSLSFPHFISYVLAFYSSVLFGRIERFVWFRKHFNPNDYHVYYQKWFHRNSMSLDAIFIFNTRRIETKNHLLYTFQWVFAIVVGWVCLKYSFIKRIEREKKPKRIFFRICYLLQPVSTVFAQWTWVTPMKRSVKYLALEILPLVIYILANYKLRNQKS